MKNKDYGFFGTINEVHLDEVLGDEEVEIDNNDVFAIVPKSPSIPSTPIPMSM